MKPRVRLCWPLVILIALTVPLVGAVAAENAEEVLRLGIVTDVHAHDTDSPREPGGAKVMTNYADRLGAFITAMNDWPADLIIQLGDLVNGRYVSGAPLGEPERIPGILEAADRICAGFEGPRYHVVGNHDVYDLSKQEILEILGIASTSYSFDAGAYHMVVLDAQYERSGKDYGHIGWMVQGTIPRAELDWLEADLAATDKPTIVCTHQPLDSSFSLLAGGPPVSNHLEVQEILAAPGTVIAVFQGHTHENGHTEIDGIHYVTFAAMVEEFSDSDGTAPTWAHVTLDPVARTITIDGVGIQASIALSYTAAEE